MSHLEFQCETSELDLPTQLTGKEGETNSTEDQEPDNIEQTILDSETNSTEDQEPDNIIE